MSLMEVTEGLTASQVCVGGRVSVYMASVVSCGPRISALEKRITGWTGEDVLYSFTNLIRTRTMRIFFFRS